MTVKLGAVVLELDADTYVPKLRFQNITLMDREGVLIASAPKAAVTLDAKSLLSGAIVPVDLELIGPSIRGQRALDGRFELGILAAASPADETEEFDGTPEGDPLSKTDLGGQPSGNDSSGAVPNAVPQIVAFLAADQDGATLSALKEIKISKARVTLFDEANNANWFAPKTDLTFRRTATGFVIFAAADVASAGEPWRAEVTATYRKQSRTLSVSTRVANVIPANVAQQIYALSQFAKAQLPLSGVVDLEFNAEGRVTKSTTQLVAGAGLVSFPEYFSQTLKINGGNLNLGFDPAAGFFDIIDSSMDVDGTLVSLGGNIKPNWAADGRVASYDISVKAINPKGASQNAGGEELVPDSVAFVGTALVEEQKLEISDLTVLAGRTGVRLNGVLTAGNESAGLQLAGRFKDVSAPLLKRLWPPIMAPQTLRWINANVLSGRIAEGTFHVNLSTDTLAQALREKKLPANSINVQLSMTDVRTKYFKALPPLENATATMVLVDNQLDLKIASGVALLEGQKALNLDAGTFTATDLLADEVPGEFEFKVSGAIATLLQFVELPDIRTFMADKPALPDLEGNVQAQINLKLPLIKDVPRDRVQLKTALALSDVTLRNVVDGIDLTAGKFSIDYAGPVIEVRGPAKLNGLEAQVIWQKPKGTGQAVTGIEMVLDAKTREKLGIKLDDILKGSVPVKVALRRDGESLQAEVEADLSKANISIALLGFKREPVSGTSARFSVVQTPNGSRQVSGIDLSGEGLQIAGDLQIAKDGRLVSADLSKVRLGESTYSKVKLANKEGTLSLEVEGNEFDARPYIGKIASPLSEAASTKTANNLNLVINARFARVQTFRGELIEGAIAKVSIRDGKITALQADGKFVNGREISVQMAPTEIGRDLRVSSSDGGATLRAANFYSKVAGGELQFFAQIDNATGAPIRNGELRITNFEVRNEAALAELDNRGKPKKSGPRRDGISFKRLNIPFATDLKYVRLPDIELKGNDMGAVAKGVVRKADGALDITGTIIPAQGINGAFDDIPLLGEILSGGDNEGIFGITFAMGGTMQKPKWQVNPISALAPGIFRKLFEFRRSRKSTTPSPY